jgi:predicted RNase H-like HicB family nuclease
VQVTAILTHAAESGFVAYDTETGTTSQGNTTKDSLAKLLEAVELYLEGFRKIVSAAPHVTTLNLPEYA